MIEIPESINLAAQIEREMKGKTIVSVLAAQTKHGFAWYNGDPAEYPAKFNGKVVEGAVAYGGKLHVKLSDDCNFLFNDGINVRYITDGKLPKKHQLLWDFGDGTHMYCTVSMYGGMNGYRGTNEGWYDQVARERPQVLSDEFTFEYFASILGGVDRAKLSAKAFLATEQRIPGLGNGVLHDILWNAEINPRRRMDTLSDADIERLYNCVRDTIRAMTEQGGRDVEKDIYGKPGGYRTILSRLTYEFPCLRCGGAIKKEAYLGGSVYYCADCQK